MPAITGGLAGFGVCLMDNFPDHDANGVFVDRRRHVSQQTTVYQVAGWLRMLCRTSLRDRIALRNRAEQHAEHFDWTGLSNHYRQARTLAFQKYRPHPSILPRES